MRRRFAAALAGMSLLVSGCGFKGLYTASLPGGADLGNHPYTVTIEFDNVLDLVPQSSVKVNDVAVGKVTAIALSQDCGRRKCSNVNEGRWVAKVQVAVRDTVDLPENARASILQTSLLGEKYVALMQPSSAPSAAKLHNGSNIDISRTSSAPEAEQVLGALSLVLNEGGLRQIRSIASELNKALHGQDRRTAIRDLLGQLNTFIGTLDNQKNDITTALTNVNTLASTLNRQKSILVSALDTFPSALKVLSQERGKLVRLLTSLSDLGVVANRVINSTQRQLVTSLKALDPVLLKLTGAGDAVPQSLRIGLTFPFPLGLTRQIVRGDYANLHAIFNLNLTEQLCGLGLPLPGCSSASQQLGLQALKKLLPGLPEIDLSKLFSLSTKTTPLAPTLIGAGK